MYFLSLEYILAYENNERFFYQSNVLFTVVNASTYTSDLFKEGKKEQFFYHYILFRETYSISGEFFAPQGEALNVKIAMTNLFIQAVMADHSIHFLSCV